MSVRANCWDTQSNTPPSAAFDLTRAGIGYVLLRLPVGQLQCSFRQPDSSKCVVACVGLSQDRASLELANLQAALRLSGKAADGPE